MTLPDLSPLQWLACAIAALCIGLSKGGFGGFAMISVLVMANILPARESTGAILPMLIMGDIFAVRMYHKHSDGRLVLGLLPAAVAGVVIGWLLMPHISAETFGKVIGWLIIAFLGFSVVQQWKPNLTRFATEHPLLSLPCGLFAGITTMLANAAGPVMTIYLLARRLPKMVFVGTAAWFFFAINVIKVPFSASLGLINGSSITLNLILAPAVIAGVFTARYFLGKVNQSTFEWIMIALSFAGAVKLIL
jgi:uncharacterized membrane protein YfcA